MRTGKLAQGWERVGVGVDLVRLWLGQAWRIGLMMAKGAYLLGERRRLFLKLGEEAYRRFSSGEIKDAELDPLLKQIERLTKKIEIEEMLIQNVRFGKKETSPPQPYSEEG